MEVRSIIRLAGLGQPGCGLRRGKPSGARRSSGFEEWAPFAASPSASVAVLFRLSVEHHRWRLVFALGRQSAFRHGPRGSGSVRTSE